MPRATNQFDELARYVAHERRRKKLSIDKVAKQLGIPAATIKDLENDKTTEVPVSHAPGLYARYAKLLSIPSADVQKLLAKTEEKKSKWVNQAPQHIRGQVYLSRLGRIGMVSIVLGLILLYAMWQLLILTSAPRLMISTPDRLSIVTKPEVSVTGVSQNDATVLINGDPVPVAENETFTQTVYLQKGYNVIDISAINSFARVANHQVIVFYQSEEL